MPYHYVERFKQRMRQGPSFVSLVGTGPNCTSQLPVLHALGDDVLSTVKRVNIISASCVSYFFHFAVPLGQIQPKGYAAYERQMRLTHQGSIWRFIRHLATGRAARAYFDFPLLKTAFSMIFKEAFLARPLSSFPRNLAFYAYSAKRRRHIEITPASHPKMTMLEVCCACTAVPFLHGRFHYQGDELADCSFAEGFKCLRQQWFQETGNHLVVNIKKEGESDKAIYVKNSRHLWPTLMVCWDFLSLCLGIPNRNIHRTHQDNLQLLYSPRQTLTS